MIRDKVEKVIKELVSAARNRIIYEKGHNSVKDAINRFHSILCEVLSEQEEITIGIIGDEIAFEKEPFYKMSKNIASFISDLKEMKIEKVTFLRGVTKDEVGGFIDIFAMSFKSIEKAGGAGKVLYASGIKNILFGEIGLTKEKTAEGGINLSPQNDFQEGIDFLTKVAIDISSGQPLDANAARFLVNKIIGNFLKNKYQFLIVTSIKGHDEYTFVHSVNVAILSIAQAQELGLRESVLADIGVAGLLHDTGKLILSGNLLRKKEKLSQEDFEKIHVHPIAGAKILIQTPGINPIAAITAFEHHVRYDMQGYPKKLYGDTINLASMIIAIADVYDAVRGRRAYRKEIMPEAAYEELMKLSGGFFHPALLDHFFSVVGVYPPGTLVELDNGAIGFVVKESPLDIRRPQVEILYNSAGGKEKNPYIINLLEKKPDTQDYKWSIVRSIVPSDKYEIPAKYMQ